MHQLTCLYQPYINAKNVCTECWDRFVQVAQTYGDILWYTFVGMVADLNDIFSNFQPFQSKRGCMCLDNSLHLRTIMLCLCFTGWWGAKTGERWGSGGVKVMESTERTLWRWHTGKYSYLFVSHSLGLSMDFYCPVPKPTIIQANLLILGRHTLL